MVDVEPFPFADVDDLKARWPEFPVGGEAHAEVLLEDASQYILDVCDGAATASESTRRRVACAIVKRSMNVADELDGMSSMQETTGGVSRSWSPSNPNGDFYLAKAERQALGCGKGKAFGVQIGCAPMSGHLPWCNLTFGATWCSCGTDIAGHPIYELG